MDEIGRCNGEIKRNVSLGHYGDGDECCSWSRDHWDWLDCNTAYDVGSQLDHCAQEGLCWDHCTNYKEHFPSEEYLDWSQEDNDPDAQIGMEVEDKISIGTTLSKSDPNASWNLPK